MEIVGLGVVQIAQILLLEFFGRQEQRIPVKNIAYQGLDPGFIYCGLHGLGVVPVQGDGFLNEDVLARLCGFDRLLRVEVVGRADTHDVHIRVL